MKKMRRFKTPITVLLIEHLEIKSTQPTKGNGNRRKKKE